MNNALSAIGGFLSRLWKPIDHNPWTALFLVAAASLCIWVYGCESTTKDPVSGGEVTRDQLDASVTAEAERIVAEADAEIARLEGEIAELQRQISSTTNLTEAQINGLRARLTAAVADLDRQDEMKAQALAALQEVAASALPGLPGGGLAVPLVMSVLGNVGLYLDRRRKNIVLNGYKARAHAAESGNGNARTGAT